MRTTPRACLVLATVIAACADDGAAGVTDLTDLTTAEAVDVTTTAEVDEVTTSACPLAAGTLATGTVSASGCALVERDTSACRAAREALGLSGAWLAFSCRVTLEPATLEGLDVVRVTADGQPDYPSMYFQATDPCYEAWADGAPNPNRIVARARTIDVPRASVEGATTMGGGIVGVAVNGVPIFADFAAPGDDIFAEVATFDRCAAHPAPGGTYHYHGEPPAISSDDARLIGVLRDGYTIYGRRDVDGSLPTLDAHGGHVGTTPDSPEVAVYHYHLNEQVSATAGTAGQRQWFLTTGTYRGVPADCLDCR